MAQQDPQPDEIWKNKNTKATIKIKFVKGNSVTGKYIHYERMDGSQGNLSLKNFLKVFEYTGMTATPPMAPSKAPTNQETPAPDIEVGQIYRNKLAPARIAVVIQITDRLCRYVVQIPDNRGWITSDVAKAAFLDAYKLIPGMLAQLPGSKPSTPTEQEEITMKNFVDKEKIKEYFSSRDRLRP